MFQPGWRERAHEYADANKVDVLIIGGGVTGAALFRTAIKHGLKAMLVEQNDFASGTSSRSSKMVHGGLRYLAQGKFSLVRDSVKERKRMLDQVPGLVNPIEFIMANYAGAKPSRRTLRSAFKAYDMIAMQRTYKFFPRDQALLRMPHLREEGLISAQGYMDATTDDARLVLRAIQEAVADGGHALNYAPAKELIRSQGKVCGAAIEDKVTGKVFEVKARIVVNATGPWCDELRQQVKHDPALKMRPLRGSHILVPNHVLPVAVAVSLSHPWDGRPVFAYPWEGATLIGTTDIDHRDGMSSDPRISGDEVAYLMAAMHYQFPGRKIKLDDIIATYAGVRPTVDTGAEEPSEESRNHVVWVEEGLVTVTGGKLTTWALTARRVLRQLVKQLPHIGRKNFKGPIFTNSECPLVGSRVGHNTSKRLCGRYGSLASALVEQSTPAELDLVPGTRTTWAELKWAAGFEGVHCLADLMLRRTRIGLLVDDGGEDLMPRIRKLCRRELGWSDERWDQEEATYLTFWRDNHHLPDAAKIPAWDKPL